MVVRTSTFISRGPAGPAGPAGKDGAPGRDGVDGQPGVAGPAGPPGKDGATGPAGKDGSPGVAGPAGKDGAAGATGPAGKDGAPGAAGPAGTPKRVARFTGATDATGVATITFSPAFTTLDDVDVITGWSGDQMVAGGVTQQSVSGCKVAVKVSRGTLLLTAGPFQTAGAGVSITVRAIGT